MNVRVLLIDDEENVRAGMIAALRGLWADALPALLITGDTAPDRLREALASGITLLHKPVSPSHLYQGLVTALPPQMRLIDAPQLG